MSTILRRSFSVFREVVYESASLTLKGPRLRGRVGLAGSKDPEMPEWLKPAENGSMLTFDYVGGSGNDTKRIR